MARHKIAVTPRGHVYHYANQDCDEQTRLLADLRTHPRDYLAHPDGFVRCHADWTMEYYGIRSLRSQIDADPIQAGRCLDQLYARLRVLAAAALLHEELV